MSDVRRWRAVAAAMAVGAVYDGVFGISILGFPGLTSRLLGIPLPDDPFYLHLNGVFLLILAALYGAAARAPERYRAIPPIAAGGRVLGCALFTWAFAGGRPWMFLALGLADLALALVTLLVWRRATRVALSD